MRITLFMFADIWPGKMPAGILKNNLNVLIEKRN